MRLTFWQRLDHFARSLTPFALAILLIVVSLTPLRLPGLSFVGPWVALIAVFFWTTHRPDLLPAWAIFLLGVFADLAGGQPLGASSLALLLVQLAVRAQRRHIVPHPFIVQWVIFALIAVAAEAVLYLLHIFAYERLLAPSAAGFQVLTTIALYPCFAWLFSQAQRLFLRQA